MAVKNQMKAKLPPIGRLMVDELTVGGDVVDRSTVYAYTKDYTREQLESLREDVNTVTMDFYKSLGSVSKVTDETLSRDQRWVERMLHSWLGPWGRFAGRMEYEMENDIRDNQRVIDEKYLTSVMDKYLNSPEAVPFSDRKFCGFAYNRCVEYGLDYTQLPERYLNEASVKAFRADYPYLVESEHETLLRQMRAMTSLRPDGFREYQFPREFTLQGESVTKFLTYRLPEEKRDYDYIVFKQRDVDGPMMHPISDLPKNERIAVMERINDAVKYGPRKKKINNGPSL